MASQLSPRQREILDLVAEGRTSKEIAVALGISESTVNWHLANAFQRLGASSRAEAVALAIRSNGATPAAAERPAQIRPVPGLMAWPRLVAIAVAIALAGALLGGATVATFHLGQAPAATARPTKTAEESATSSPGSGSRPDVVGGESQPVASGEPAADTTLNPPREPSSTLAPAPILSAPPLPTVPIVVPTPALPTLPVTTPPLPISSLPPLPLPTPTLPIP